MKQVFIVHGWDGNPKEPMLQWLKSSLEEKGYQVTAPEMPETTVPVIEKWVGKLKEIIQPTEETILVGHSIGCQAILRYLETLGEGIKIPGIVLIAPWMELDKQTMEDEGPEGIEIARPWMETPIDFATVKSHIEKAVCIFSDNDPYVPLSQKDLFEKELGAGTVIEHNKGHFTVGDGVTELPAALDFFDGI